LWYQPDFDQIELKMYEHHFYKADREELDRLIEAA
jgi:hypothetical protein